MPPPIHNTMIASAFASGEAIGAPSGMAHSRLGAPMANVAVVAVASFFKNCLRISSRGAVGSVSKFIVNSLQA